MFLTIIGNQASNMFNIAFIKEFLKRNCSYKYSNNILHVTECIIYKIPIYKNMKFWRRRFKKNFYTDVGGNGQLNIRLRDSSGDRSYKMFFFVNWYFVNYTFCNMQNIVGIFITTVSFQKLFNKCNIKHIWSLVPYNS
jgi:hypothetical protein